MTCAIQQLSIKSGQIRQATREDATLKQAIQFVKTSWPASVSSHDLKQLFHRRQNLRIVNECLMFGERVVIPNSLRMTALKQFHSGHPRIARMKSIARSYAYWPSMDADIKDFVNRCHRCQAAAKEPPREPPRAWPTSKPWSRLHVDFAGPMEGVYYLVLVDSYSKWPEVVQVTPPSSSRTVSVLEKIFSCHGIPEVVVSDNGSQFTAQVFQEFCKRNGIQHVRTPPYHPQSNGQAERFVDTFKRALLKAGGGAKPETIQNFLFVYRTTPLAEQKKSPAELLMGRMLRTYHHSMLPSSSHQRRNSLKYYRKGDAVYVRDYRPGNRKWAEGLIECRHGTLMYKVKVGDEWWIRHKNQIRRRYTTCQEFKLPLDLLLETFKIPPVKPEAKQEMLPSRRFQRKRTQTVHFQIDPKKKRY